MGSRVVRTLTLSTLMILVALAGSPALASFPGSPGKLLVRYQGQLWSVNPDGSDFKLFLDLPGGGESNAAWSADGQKIAFVHPDTRPYPEQPDIWVADADGSNAHQVIAGGRHPSWSPDGTRLTFLRTTDGETDVFVADADGTDQINITQSDHDEIDPVWSPNAEKIAFGRRGEIDYYEVHLIDPAGGPSTRVGTGTHAEWSPFGDELIVSDGTIYPYKTWRHRLDGSQPTVFFPAFSQSWAWNPDGTTVAYIYNGLHMVSYDGNYLGLVKSGVGNYEGGLAWQPVPRPPAPRYPRPKGATPAYVPLVPAYRACSTPDREHGPPLAFGSCSVPQQTGTTATLGTADSNGQPAKSVGFVRLDALPGNAATTADEADVGVYLGITDVRRTGDLSDYTASLTVPLAVRLTYRGANGDQATMREPTESTAAFHTWPLRATAPCTATADPGVGATCSVTTTAEAIVGGNAVREGERGIWGLGQVRVYDAGPDQSAVNTEDNEVFAVQGVFVP